MSKNFTVTVHNPERAAVFEALFGGTTVCVKSPIPLLMTLPEVGEKRAYLLDLDTLTPEQRDKLIFYLMRKFAPLLEDEAKEGLQEHGLPILTEDCVLTVHNPAMWVDLDCMTAAADHDNGDEDYDDDDWEREFEDAMSECGLTESGACLLAGTEYCDWKCPVREWGSLNPDGVPDEEHDEHVGQWKIIPVDEPTSDEPGVQP